MSEEGEQMLIAILQSISESLRILVDTVEQVAERAGYDEEN